MTLQLIAISEMSGFEVFVRVNGEQVEIQQYCDVVACHGSVCDEGFLEEPQIFLPSPEKWAAMGVEFEKSLSGGDSRNWSYSWDSGRVQLAYSRDVLGERVYGNRKLWFLYGSVVFKFDLEQVLSYHDQLLGTLLLRLPRAMRYDSRIFSYLATWSVLNGNGLYRPHYDTVLAKPDVVVTYEFEWIPQKKYPEMTCAEMLASFTVLPCGCSGFCSCDDLVQSRASASIDGETVMVETIVSSPVESESSGDSITHCDFEVLYDVEADIHIVDKVSQLSELKGTDVFIHIDIGSQEYLDLVNFDHEFLYTPVSVFSYVKSIVGDLMDCNEDHIRTSVFRVLQERSTKNFFGEARCKKFLDLFAYLVTTALDVRYVSELMLKPFSVGTIPCTGICSRKTAEGFCALSLFDDMNRDKLRCLLRSFESVSRLKRLSCIYPLYEGKVWLYAFRAHCGIVFHVQREPAVDIEDIHGLWYDKPARIIRVIEQLSGVRHPDGENDKNEVISLGPMHLNVGLNHVVLISLVTVYYRSLEIDPILLAEFKAVIAQHTPNIFDYLPDDVPRDTFKSVMIDNIMLSVVPMCERYFPYLIHILADRRYIKYLVDRYERWGFSLGRAVASLGNVYVYN